MRKKSKIFEIALKNLIKFCFDNELYSMYFFGESDLKYFLVNKIMNIHNKLRKNKFPVLPFKENILNKRKKIAWGYAPMVLTEVPYSKRVIIKNQKKEKGFKCDILILDENSFFLKINKKELNSKKRKKRIYAYEYYFEKNVFIELKFSWNKKRQTIIDEIMSDSNKLNQRDIKCSYIVYLDYSGKLTHSDIINRTKKVNIIYIDPSNKRVLCNKKGLQKYYYKSLLKNLINKYDKQISNMR